jgi:hypothetical protein
VQPMAGARASASKDRSAAPYPGPTAPPPTAGAFLFATAMPQGGGGFTTSRGLSCVYAAAGGRRRSPGRFGGVYTAPAPGTAPGGFITLLARGPSLSRRGRMSTQSNQRQAAACSSNKVFPALC